MLDTKKYLLIMSILLSVLLVGISIINIFISSLTHLFSILLNIITVISVIIIVFSMIITYMVANNKNINKNLMKINFSIVNILFPIILGISSIFGISKNEIRKIYIKLNNAYIYSNKYEFKVEELLILLPHCVQRNICSVKVTSNIKNCKKCGKCDIEDLVKIQENKNIKVVVATGGTLARKIIIENKPKAVIAVACERDLTSGIQDIKKIPVLGIFNKRPNGPCIDTKIETEEIEKAIEFFTNKSILKIDSIAY